MHYQQQRDHVLSKLTRAIGGDDGIDKLCRDRVQDPVTLTRNQMPILHDADPCSCKLLAKRLVFVRHIADIHTIQFDMQ